MGDFLEEAGQLMSLSMMVSASSGPSRLMGGGGELLEVGNNRSSDAIFPSPCYSAMMT